MIELPEAVTIARQIDRAAAGLRVRHAIAGASPHKFAWFHGDPAGYDPLLRDRAVGGATSHGGFVEVELEDARLLFAEGVVLRWHGAVEAPPARHQLLVGFDDGSALSATVQMYGGLWAYRAGTFQNTYLEAALRAPSPLSPAFDEAHFARLLDAPDAANGSLKALLATKQRVPGLGNGVLQDILFEARLHPKRKVASLTGDERSALSRAVTSTLAEMTRQGGRDTERDLHGRPGGYATRLSRLTVGQPCGRCGTTTVKQAYLGGAIYVCPGCQVA
jgi:formamidopyrimidine-DNA glycosylase